eukprot:CAMPEP_0185192618 /NCGR_PEP_ID=MMETSP1140-20130426/19559_1 /TAXON_ID=298111 /ORGANISM="Pavlova sp., Strain CCMP459" /LENGTH=189 /DNA_ID=CAMNT_0027759373 /DNA_START=173 /DNA_END=743 /DNA_ORIENTATION=+
MSKQKHTLVALPYGEPTAVPQLSIKRVCDAGSFAMTPPWKLSRVAPGVLRKKPHRKSTCSGEEEADVTDFSGSGHHHITKCRHEEQGAPLPAFAFPARREGVKVKREKRLEAVLEVLVVEVAVGPVHKAHPKDEGGHDVLHIVRAVAHEALLELVHHALHHLLLVGGRGVHGPPRVTGGPAGREATEDA